MPIKQEDIRKAFRAFESAWLSKIRSGVVVLSVMDGETERLWNYKKRKLDVEFPKRLSRVVVEARGPFRVSIVDIEKLRAALSKGKPKTRTLAAGSSDVGLEDYVAMSMSAKRGKGEIWTAGAPTHLAL